MKQNKMWMVNTDAFTKGLIQMSKMLKKANAQWCVKSSRNGVFILCFDGITIEICAEFMSINMNKKAIIKYIGVDYGNVK
jgi:hypothetical protein